MANDPQSETVNRIFIQILGREATRQEKSQYRLLDQYMLQDTARTILHSERHNNEKFRTLDDAEKTVKHFGVSLVSPFNKQCGISTYTENLYKHISIPKSVVSESCASRGDCVEEKNVNRVWSIGAGDMDLKIIDQARKDGNRIVHIQHEFGIFNDNDMLFSLISNLKKCGFKVVITMHTIMRTLSFDAYYRIADVIIVHSEEAASRLYGKGINNLTVVNHGTEEPIDVDFKESIEFVKSMINYELGDVLGCSVGFISKDKMQEEVLEAADKASQVNKKLKFLLVGDTGRRSYDDEYMPILERHKGENISVVKKFLSAKEIAMLLDVCDFAVMNYHPTNYSISGASHLLMTYGVPSISSDSEILSDLTPGMSLKVKCEDIDGICNAMINMAEDQSMRTSMGNNAFAAGSSTRWDKITKVHEGVYRSICDAN